MGDDRAAVPAATDGASSRAGATWGSLLSTQDFAAITSVGFEPVGSVLGAVVVHLGYVTQRAKCSAIGTYTPGTDLASASADSFNALLRKRYGVRRQALSRAIEECQALGGDGIVGVTLSIRPFPAGGTEFSVMGTAIRARTGIHPAAPFTSHLSAEAFARLLRSGWVPTALVFGIALGARHDDARTRKQARRKATGEVRGYSQLIRETRRDARVQLEQAVAAQGADGVVVDEMTLHIGERECPTEEGSRDHMAEATIMGTTIAAFARSPDAGGWGPLTIMPLNPSPTASTGLRPVSPPESEPQPDSEAGLLDRFLSAWAARRAAHAPVAFSDSAGVARKPEL
jgi:uncharacterized protein YbjQ (UPF0145 family)